MRKGNSSGTQQELVAKLQKVQALVADCVDLVAQLKQAPSRLSKSSGRTQHTDRSVNFEMNERRFVKQYAKSLSGGPKKFVAILAYLAKGDTNKEVSLNEIEQLWNKTSSKALLGMKFNRFFPTTAKEHGWVNSKKRGLYNLDRSWKDIFAND
jgi:hypothetical protein